MARNTVSQISFLLVITLCLRSGALKLRHSDGEAGNHAGHWILDSVEGDPVKLMKDVGISLSWLEQQIGKRNHWGAGCLNLLIQQNGDDLSRIEWWTGIGARITGKNKPRRLTQTIGNSRTMLFEERGLNKGKRFEFKVEWDIMTKGGRRVPVLKTQNPKWLDGRNMPPKVEYLIDDKLHIETTSLDGKTTATRIYRRAARSGSESWVPPESDILDFPF